MAALFSKRGATLLTLSILTLGWMGCDSDAPTGVPTPELTTEGKPSGGGSGGSGGSTGGTKPPATFGGQATGIRASGNGSTSYLSNTATIPAQGGALEASLLDAGVADMSLTAQSLHAGIVAQGDRNRSESSAADFSVSLGGLNVTASFVMARATVVSGRRGVTGSAVSRVENLTINGKPVAVTGSFQQISITGVGYVNLNEAHFGSGYETVRALHIMVPGVNGDVVVGEAVAGMVAGTIDCSGTNDFVTGDGWMTGTPSSSRATFGAAGGMNAAGGMWGHLVFNDGSGSRVQGTGVTSYAVVNATTRHIDGTCDIDGVPGTYSLNLTDNGEPGTADTFDLTLSNGYHAGGILNAGNLQLHVPCR
jgi:hypothetical protein